jgi:glycosyltransferase involved in cell wall biosynthesis
MPDAPPRIAAVTTCKGRLEHLKQTLPRLMALPFEEVVVVDFDCPEGSGDWAEANCPGVRVVRVTGEPIFHCARARNLGGAATTAPWLLFIDVDVLVAPELLNVVGPLLGEGQFSRAQPLAKECWGTIFVARADYEAVGGYDEVFRNWGGEDDDLVWSLTRIGRQEVGFPGALVEPIAHPDTMRVQHHAYQDRFGSGRRNGLYGLIKQAVIRQVGPIDRATRQRLYDTVSQGIGRDAVVESFVIPLASENLYGVTVETSLRFNLTQFDEPEVEAEGQTPSASASSRKSST